jgi:hypothetical protein
VAAKVGREGEAGRVLGTLGLNNREVRWVEAFGGGGFHRVCIRHWETDSLEGVV